MKLRGKAALITGGGVRIGRSLTLALANAGCDVLIHYGRSGQQAEGTRDSARALGVRAELCGADLSDPDAVSRVAGAAMRAFGEIDILINNAAVFPDADKLATTDAELWDQIFAINLRAPFLLSQAFARQIGSRRGRIVNIVDARTRRPQTDHFAYRLSKQALWQMTEMLALELAPGTTVNAIALGAILPPPGQNRAYLEKIAAAHIPIGSPGNTEDVTTNALHLLTQDFLTGTIIELDGGQFL